MCKASSRSQSDFGGKRAGLPITIGLALWRREDEAIGSSSLLYFGSSLNLSIGFSIYHQHYIITLASAAGRKEHRIPPQRQAVNVVRKQFEPSNNCR